MSQPLTDSSTKFKKVTEFPHVQINRAQLADGIDAYIRTRLFGQEIDPMDDENWRVLLVDPVTEHIMRTWARQLLEAEDTATAADAEVTHRLLSEVPKLTMRESASLTVEKSIYLVETKAQGQVNTPNVKRKKRAAVAWCDKINTLAPEQRGNAEWHYVLLGEDVFYEWHDKGASVRDMLDYAKLRPVDERVQATFAF